MPRILLHTYVARDLIPIQVETSHVKYFQNSIAKNRPGTYLHFLGEINNPLFVEETYPEILLIERNLE